MNLTWLLTGKWWAGFRRACVYIAVFFTLFHTARLFIGHDSCWYLLNSSGSLAYPGTAKEEWRPTGCMMRDFSKNSVAAFRCLAGRRIVFAGDSRSRQLYETFIRMLDKSITIPTVYHEDSYVVIPPPAPLLTPASEKLDQMEGGDNRLGRNITVEFLWLPYMHEQSLASISSKLIVSPSRLETVPNVAGSGKHEDAGVFHHHHPSLIVQQAGLWDIKAGITPEDFEIAVHNILQSSINIVKYVQERHIAAVSQPPPPLDVDISDPIAAASHWKSFIALWAGTHRDVDLYFSTIQPVFEDNLNANRSMITNAKIEAFNSILNDKLEWYSSEMLHLFNKRPPPYLSNLHPDPEPDGRLSLEPLHDASLPLHESEKAYHSIPIGERHHTAPLFAPTVVIGKSAYHIAKSLASQFPDGLHLTAAANTAHLNVILNSFCNRRHDPVDRPDDVTCCAPYPPLTSMQIWMFFVAGFLVVVAATLRFAPALIPRRFLAKKGVDGTLPTSSQADLPSSAASPVPATLLSQAYDLLIVGAKFGALLVFIFLCDRTHIFPKEKKHYSSVELIVSCGVLLVGGIFTVSPVSGAPTFLNRDQTDEWKGWMQIVFLIYHFLGGSSILPLYLLVRIFVASYLFLTGFGHFTFFYTKKQFGVARVIQVLTRLNLLTVLLCLVMDKPYQFYYFVPLSSFWFLTVYAAMAVPSLPLVQSRWPWVDAPMRIVALFVLSSVVWIPFSSNWNSVSASDFPLFELLFNWTPMRQIFSINGSLYEWRFRSGLDCFIIAHGMLLAYSYQIAKQRGIVLDSQPASAAGALGLLFAPTVSLAVGILSVVLSAWYLMFASTCSDKALCNHVHTFASPFLVTSFVVLRNFTLGLRKNYSRFFAFIGKLSLELFLLQFHIWLAADTKGILLLVPGAGSLMRLLNALVTTSLFVALCDYASELSNPIVAILAPADNWAAARRFAGVLLVCCLAWIQRQTGGLAEDN